MLNLPSSGRTTVALRSMDFGRTLHGLWGECRPYCFRYSQRAESLYKQYFPFSPLPSGRPTFGRFRSFSRVFFSLLLRKMRIYTMDLYTVWRNEYQSPAAQRYVVPVSRGLRGAWLVCEATIYLHAVSTFNIHCMFTNRNKSPILFALLKYIIL